MVKQDKELKTGKEDNSPAHEKEESITTPVTEEQLKVLEEVVAKYKSASDYTKEHYHKIWEDSWKAYHNQRTAAQYAGIADNFVPEVFTIVESIKANIIGGEQRFEYFPTREDQKADTKALNALVEHYWYTNGFPAESLKWIQDDVALGTGILWTFWDSVKGVVPMYVPLRDNFVDPTAKNYNDANFAGFRYLTTIDSLEEQKTVNEKGEVVPRFMNLELVEESIRTVSDELDKEVKDSLLGSTLNEEAKKDQVEIIYYIDKEQLVQIANRSVVIEMTETPFKRDAKMVKSNDDMGNPVEFELPEIKPFIPFAPARNYIDGSLFYGRGDIEIILPSQELLNDTSNQKTDNLNYIINKIVIVDPAYADEEDKLDSIPGAKWFLPPGSVEWLNMQPIGADADNEMNRIVSSMRRATAADEIIQGMGSGGRTTATEIRAQLAQAGTRFSIKLKNLEREGMKILANNFFKLIQIHVTKEIAVRSIGAEGVEFLNFNPGEYLGDYEPKVLLDTTAAAVKEEEKQNAMQFFQMASQIPGVNVMELFKQTASKMFNIRGPELDGLMSNPQTMAPQPGQPQPQAGPSDQEMQAIQQALQSGQITQDEAQQLMQGVQPGGQAQQ